MSFINTYNNFDLLRIPISLSYKNKYLYRTFVGASLTIIGIIILVVYFLVKVTGAIKKKSFAIISNEFQNQNASINFTNIPILFALADNKGNPLELNPKIVDFSVVMSEYVRNIDKNGNNKIIYLENQIEIDRCDKLNDSIDFSYFDEYNLSDFKCIKPFQNLSINGTFGDIINGFKSLRINIKKCNNLIEECYDSGYIESIISNSRFIIVYSGHKTNFYNKKEKDIEKAVYSRSISLSPVFCKKVFYYLTLVKFKLYDNILLGNKKEEIYFLNRDMFYEFSPISDINVNDINEDNVLAFFSFVYDGNMIEYTKKVEKLGEIISYIGNLFNIILTIFRIINSYFSNKILFFDIFYRFFFEEKFKKKKDSKNIQFDNSNLFLFAQKRVSSIKINTKTQDKSNNSNLNFNSYLEDKSIENQNNLNNSNSPKKAGFKKILSLKSKNIEKEKSAFSKHSKLYYLCPLCIIRNKKNLKHLIEIKNSICYCFSLESFNEFLKIKKSINIMKKEKINDILFQNRSHFSDKNIRAQINRILNFK